MIVVVMAGEVVCGDSRDGDDDGDDDDDNGDYNGDDD